MRTRIPHGFRLSGICTAALLLVTTGCPPTEPPKALQPLAGLWKIERGGVSVKFTWTVAGGGETEVHSKEHELEPLDPADFPEELAELVAQWNAGLEELNASLDEAFPDEVAVAFPQPAKMQLWNPVDPKVIANGLINAQLEYGFITDLRGGGFGSPEGAGGVLHSASIEGSFEIEPKTTTGQVIRRLVMFLVGADESGVSFTAEVMVDYTGERSGDLP